MSLTLIKGDLFDPAHNFLGLAQGVNAQGIMGAGIAVPFREKFPDMYRDYKNQCAMFKHILPGLLHTFPSEDGTVIFNMFSQEYPGRNGDYKLLESSAYLLRREAEARFAYHLTHTTIDVKVGLPWIGCGIAGLERHNVWHLLNRTLRDSEVEFVLVEQ